MRRFIGEAVLNFEDSCSIQSEILLCISRAEESFNAFLDERESFLDSYSGGGE